MPGNIKRIMFLKIIIQQSFQKSNLKRCRLKRRIEAML